MKPRIMLSLIVISVILEAFSVTSSTQILNKAELEKTWLNLPSSPLRFKSAPKGNVYAIGNYSDARVIRYRLGCVLQDSGGISILNQRPDQEVNLAPVDHVKNEVSSKMVFSWNGKWREPFCEGAAKLAVLEVEFEDGSIWKITK